MTAADLRALRKRLGMTQAQLAEALDLTVGSISNYEGARGPYEIPRVVELACEALAQKTEAAAEGAEDPLDYRDRLRDADAARRQTLAEPAGAEADTECPSASELRAARKPMKFKRLTIIIEGHEDSDFELAMTEILRRVSEQFNSAFNNNGTGAFFFDLDEYAEVKQLEW